MGWQGYGGEDLGSVYNEQEIIYKYIAWNEPRGWGVGGNQEWQMHMNPKERKENENEKQTTNPNKTKPTNKRKKKLDCSKTGSLSKTTTHKRLYKALHWRKKNGQW